MCGVTVVEKHELFLVQQIYNDSIFVFFHSVACALAIECAELNAHPEWMCKILGQTEMTRENALKQKRSNCWREW